MTSYTLEPVDYNPFSQQPSTRKPMGFGESFAVGAGQGASMGFGDELIAGLGAGVAGTGLNLTNLLGITDVERPYGQSYENILNRQREGIEQASQDNPLAYTGGAITGAIGGVGKLAAPLAATKVGSKIASATLPTAAGRLTAGAAKVAAPAAASNYVAGFGAGEGGLENRMAKAEDDALLSAAFGVAAKPVFGAIKGIGEAVKGAFARGNKQLANASRAMKEATDKSYAEMRKYNVSLNNNGVSKVVDNINQGLQNELIDSDLNSSFIKLVRSFGNQVQKGTDIEHLDKWRRKFYSMADGIKSTDPTIKDNARLAGIVARKLDDALYNRLDDNADFVANSTNALEALRAGRQNSMQQRKFEIVSDILKKSKGDANYIKRELAKISDASTKKGENQLRFFTPDEAEQLAKVADLGVGESVLKLAGKLGFDPSRLGRGTAGFVAGGLAGGWAGAAAVPAVGTAASTAQKGLVQSRASDLLKTIERGGKALPKTNIPSPSIPIGAAVGTQPSQQEQPTPQFNLEPIDYNPFEQGTDDAYSPPRQPLELNIMPQSYNTEMEDFTQQNEGFSPTTYTDTTGNPTIGYGFNFNSGIAPRVWREAGIQTPFKQAKLGKTSITPQEAQALYQTSERIAIDDAKSYYPDFDRLRPQQQAALMDMSYQMGGNALKQFSGLKKALKNNNKNAIIKSIRTSKYYEQTPQRAEQVLQMLVTENRQ